MAAARERKIASPEPTVGMEGYWEGARRGDLLLRHCTSCDRVHHYPRALCPYCFSDRLDWRKASGAGTIYTYSVMRRAPEPYAIAYVTLKEGVSMMTNIVDCDLDQVRIGQPVKVVFKPSENGQPVPMFTPA